MLRIENTLFTAVMLIYFAAMILYFAFIALRRDGVARVAVLLRGSAWRCTRRRWSAGASVRDACR